MKIPLVALLATSLFLMLPLVCILTVFRSSLVGSMLNQPEVRHLLPWLVDSVLFSYRQPVVFEQNVSISDIRIGVIKYKRSKEDADGAVECVLCMYELEEGGEVRDLKCKHLFHRKCLDKWLLQKLTCPLCRDCLS